jgi:hypothetical protein
MMTAPEYSCDGVYVVIQAAGMNAQDCAADPVAALTFNGVATARLVMAASRTGVQRFISTQGGIFNVGAGVSQSVLGMAQLIQERCLQVLGFEPVLQRVQSAIDDPPLTR